MAVTTWTDEDVETIVSAALAGECAKGTLIHHVGGWRVKYRERVLQNERAWPGYIESTVRGMTSEQTEDEAPVERDPARLMRRLADAKLDELSRYGVKDPDRTRIAVDYAVGAVHGFRHDPFGPGGVGALEDALYVELGMDRVSGLRHSQPQAPAG